jgi:hypothetical protein
MSSTIGSSEFLAEFETVRDELVAWRSKSLRGARIPDTIWERASVLARKYSVQIVSKELKLSYSDLKRRVIGAGDRPSEKAGGLPAFVEVTPAPAPEEAGCVIELTKGSGTRMRISLKSAEAVDWSRIKEAFLGA